MHENTVFRLNTSKTISETLDQETIIINLEKGTYYSLNKTGSFLWAMITAGVRLGRIQQLFAARYDADAGVMNDSVQQTIDALKQDGLIFETEEPAQDSVKEDEVAPTKESFIPLTIDRYEDMQDMLLADPIHDVSQAGWPKTHPVMPA